MSTVTAFPQGTPIWVDFQSTDAAEAAAFYSALFDWEVSEPAGRSGGYRMALRDGVPVCAIGSLPSGLVDKGAVPTWTTYLAVDDADAAADRIREAGGTILLPPGGFGSGARLLMATDAVGAVVGLWQNGNAPRPWLRHEPGAVDWFELVTDNTDDASAFYESTLGISVSHTQVGETDYPMLAADGVVFAGVVASDVAGASTHWRAYFAVADLAAHVKLLKKLGGRVLVKPATAAGVGSWATVTDPQGAVFSLIQPEDSSSADDSDVG